MINYTIREKYNLKFSYKELGEFEFTRDLEELRTIESGDSLCSL